MNLFLLRVLLLCATAKPAVLATPSIDNSCPWTSLLLDNTFTCEAPRGATRPSAPGDATAHSAWEGPSHCVGEVCVFSNRLFGGGRGLALVTTEANARAIGRLPQPPDSGSLEKQPPAVLGPPPPFYEAQIPGKGLGLIANRTIRRGEYVMRHAATVAVQLGPHVYLAPAHRVSLYDRAVQALPARTRRAFMRQAGADVYNKVETNCFRTFIRGEGGRDDEADSGVHLGCFPEAARFNHDCRPNMQYHIKNLTQSVVAVRDVAPGEELTVSYIDSMLLRAERQERLRDWGFSCTCAQCSRGEAEAAASDARLRRIGEIVGAMDRGYNLGSTGSGSGEISPVVITAESGGELAALYEAERLDVYLGHAYTRAALNYALFGKEEKAVEYASRAVAALEREFGQDAADIASMLALAADPRGHWAWERRKDHPH